MGFATAIFPWSLDIIKITENIARNVHRERAFKG